MAVRFAAWIARWGSWLLPAAGTPTTTLAREQRRKASLLALFAVMLIVLLGLQIFPYLALGDGKAIAVDLSILAGGFGAVWLNRRGQLTWATVLLVIVALTGAIASIPIDDPSARVIDWVIVALPTFFASFFLPPWVSLAFAAIDSLMLTLCLTWPTVFGSFLPQPHPPLLIASLFFLFWAVGSIAAVYSWSLGRAVALADRAVELDQANQELRKLHQDIDRKHLYLQIVNQELYDLQAELLHQNQALSSSNARLASLAMCDPLTGLPNHRDLIARLDSMIDNANRGQEPFSLLFLDIDHFKALNDTYGHAAGDTILREFAEIAQTALREEDTLGRWGGEEYVALLAVSDPEEALQIAERIRVTVATHSFAQIGVHLTCSIGMALYLPGEQNREELVQSADRAMYHAKQTGRNRVSVAAPATGEAFTLVQIEHDTRAFAAVHGLVQALLLLLDGHDALTGAHARRVGELAEQVALRLGCQEHDARIIGLAGYLHDIGKVHVPSTILLKPGKLDPAEFDLLKMHPTVGADIIAQIPALQLLVPLIRTHHERYDGNGYPSGITGEAIPLGGRILTVVDSFDAMTSVRSYTSPRRHAEALAELQRCAGTQFDPAVVAAFADLLRAYDGLAA